MSSSVCLKNTSFSSTTALLTISQDKKSLKELAEDNPTQLGDPVSLKAETSDHQPTEEDMPNKSDTPTREGDGKTQETNPSQDSGTSEEDRGGLRPDKSSKNGQPKM